MSMSRPVPSGLPEPGLHTDEHPLLRRLRRRRCPDGAPCELRELCVAEAVEIASFTKASGLKLMIGGMVETRIAMGCSFSLVLGLGGFDVLDLDTPLLLANDPVIGGYRYNGPRLQPWSETGLDMQNTPPSHITTIE